MNKRLFIGVISTLAATASLFAQQHTQSLTFTDPGPLEPGDKFTISVTLNIGGYDTFGLSYWLEAQNALAPFLTLVSAAHFTFPDPNQPVNHNSFNSTVGSTAGFRLETPDLGGTINDPTPDPPPLSSYHITDLTFSLAPNAPIGNFTIRSTTVTPRISEVTDTDFNDNNLPAASLTLHIVPEPSTFSLISFAIAGTSLLVWRRKCNS